MKDETITYSNAGHPYPLLIRKDCNDWKMLKANGYLIGMFNDTKYENYTEKIKKGEGILHFTDGLFENPQNSEENNSHTSVMEHAKLLQKTALDNPDDFLDQLMDSFGKTDKNQIDDDIAIMYLIKK